MNLLRFVRKCRTAYKIMVSKLGDKIIFSMVSLVLGRSQWQHGLKRRYAATRLLGLRVLIPLGRGCLSVVSVVCSQIGVCATG